MAKAEYALVNENGTLVEPWVIGGVRVVETAKIAKEAGWPRHFPVVRVNNQPTNFHIKSGELGAFVSGQWVITTQYQAPDLDVVKAALKTEVDRAAGQLRAQFITVAPGQDMVYLRKAAEAKAYQTEDDPAAADYPILSASVVIEGATLADVAAMVVGKEAQWTKIAAVIEAARLGGKAAIDAAEDAVAACAAAAAIDWTLPQ